MSSSFAPPDPLEFAENIRLGFERKSGHNKSESLACFVLIVVCSLLSPLFVTLADDLWLGKVVPSILSLSAAASTAWLQLRKPQSLWSLYRNCQRRIEDHIYKYQYHLGDYATNDQERTRLLADAVRTVAWEAHQSWLPLVPTPEALGVRLETKTQMKNDPRPNP